MFVLLISDYNVKTDLVVMYTYFCHDPLKYINNCETFHEFLIANRK